jgi:hypothetical protein
MQMAKGGQPATNPSSATTGSSQRTLTDLGITSDQSSNWQKLAKVPEEEFAERREFPVNGESRQSCWSACLQKLRSTNRLMRWAYFSPMSTQARGSSGRLRK